MPLREQRLLLALGHRARGKLQVADRAQAVLRAQEAGLGTESMR